MYEDLIARIRAHSELPSIAHKARSLAKLLTQAADAIEALERNQGCPAWDSEKKICQIMNMPVKEEE